MLKNVEINSFYSGRNLEKELDKMLEEASRVIRVDLDKMLAEANQDISVDLDKLIKEVNSPSIEELMRDVDGLFNASV